MRTAKCVCVFVCVRRNPWLLNQRILLEMRLQKVQYGSAGVLLTFQARSCLRWDGCCNWVNILGKISLKSALALPCLHFFIFYNRFIPFIRVKKEEIHFSIEFVKYKNGYNSVLWYRFGVVVAETHSQHIFQTITNNLRYLRSQKLSVYNHHFSLNYYLSLKLGQWVMCVLLSNDFNFAGKLNFHCKKCQFDHILLLFSISVLKLNQK